MGKLNKKIFITIICSIVIISSFIIFSKSSYAENEIEESSNNTSESSTNTTINSTSNKVNNSSDNSNTSKNITTNSESKKSSNANLKNLGIKPHDFSGFKSGTTSYSVTVPNDTDSIEVYATVQDSSAKVTGTGKKNLEVGINDFDVTVTAEDGTKKTYTIHVTRQEEEQNTEAVQEQYSGDGLASLNIENLELSPKFDTIIYEYTVKYIGENTTLNIETTTTDPYYTVEITGNEELKEGENIINILVTDPDGKNVATYQITVNKSLVDEEAIAREQEEARKKEQQKQIIIGGIIGIILILIIIILIIRHRRNKAWAEEYSIPFSGINDDENDDNQLEDFDDNMNYIGDDEQQLSKEQAREKFLNNYNKDYNDEVEEIEETPRRKKHKGKRFK